MLARDVHQCSWIWGDDQVSAASHSKLKERAVRKAWTSDRSCLAHAVGVRKDVCQYLCVRLDEVWCLLRNDKSLEREDERGIDHLVYTRDQPDRDTELPGYCPEGIAWPHCVFDANPSGDY